MALLNLAHQTAVAAAALQAQAQMVSRQAEAQMD
jgi:hypothetical protein